MGFAEEPCKKKTGIPARSKNAPSVEESDDENLDADDDDDDEGANSGSGGATAKQKLAKYEKTKKKIRASWEKSWADMDKLMKEVVAGAVTSADYDESMKAVAL